MNPILCVAFSATYVHTTRDYYAVEGGVPGSGGTWRVLSVTADEPNPFSDKINTVVVKVEIPSDTHIMELPLEAFVRRIGFNACPPKSERLWTLYNGGYDFLQVKVANYGTTLYRDVDCARNNL